MPNELLKLSAPFDLHYRDIELYGAGAQAEVYSAWYTQFRQPVRVAIKVLNPAGCVGSSFEKLREKFLIEAEVLCGVTHPHVVRVFQVVEAELRNEPTVGFTMEWLPTTFALQLRKHPDGLPPADLRRYLEQALSGLGALHEAGVAVRDLRPANLLLSEQGQLKLADLGMARTESVALSIREQSTKFQAPEILDGSLRLAYGRGRQDPPASAYFASDLYSLGMIFYEATVGADRWRQLTALSSVYGPDGPGSGLPEDRRWEAWHANRSLGLPPVCTVCRDMPAALGAAIDGMVQKDPGQRLGRVAEVLAVLGGAGARAQEVAISVGPAASVKEPERDHQPGWWTRHGKTARRTAAAAAGVLVVAAALVAGSRLLWPRTVELTVVPDGIAGLEVRWQGRTQDVRPGTQVFRLKPAAGGQLAVLRQGAVLCDTTLTMVVGTPQTLDVRRHLPGQLTVLVNVPADITVEGQPAQRETREGRYELKHGRYRYTVSAAGYTSRDGVVEVRGNSRPEVSVTLEALPAAPAAGTVVVTVEPVGLSAPWELRGPGGYARSGAGSMVLERRAAGSYTLTWSEVSGYRRPSPGDRSRDLAGEGEVEFRGVYRSVRDQRPVDSAPGGTADPDTGMVVVTVEPAGLSALWVLRGPGGYARAGAGSTVLEGRAAGSYTLTLSEMPDYRLVGPATRSGDLAGEGEVEFRGVYRSVREQPPVDSAPGGTADPAAGTLREWTISGAKFAFRWIPAGRATIGSPPDEPCRDDDETQFTAVITRGFWLQETEVTQAQWTAVMGSNPSAFSDCPDCPVENVSWDDAQRFLQKLTVPGRGRFRLPTEVEWEYAARAGNTGPFGLPCPDYNSDNCTGVVPCLTAIAWYFDNSDRRTLPVGLKRPNRWNLYDMSGNVWEWVADRYGPYPSGVVEDYAGPRYGDQGRVLRGGSWGDSAFFVRVALRAGLEAGFRYFSFGFRCVRDRD